MLFLVSYRLDDTRGNPYAPEEVIPTIILMVMGSSIFGHKYSSVQDPRLRLIIWLNDQTTSGLNPFNPINMIPGLKSISLPFFPNYRDLNEVPIYQYTLITSFMKISTLYLNHYTESDNT